MIPFDDLIHELGQELELTLNPDSHQSCLIVFPDRATKIQLDLSENADQILLGSELGELPPGPYRDRMLHQALRANGVGEIRRGILAFSEKTDSLVLFQYLSIKDLTGKKLADFLQIFLEHATIWTQAITRGDIPQVEDEMSGTRGRI